MTLEECGALVLADSNYDAGLGYFYHNSSTCKACTNSDAATNISQSGTGFSLYQMNAITTTFKFAPSCSSQTLIVVDANTIQIDAMTGGSQMSPDQASAASYFTNSDEANCPITGYSVVDQNGSDLEPTIANLISIDCDRNIVVDQSFYV